MNFVTLSFAFFFIFVLLYHAVLRRGGFSYKCMLLVTNIGFYAFAGLSFVPLLLTVGGLNWLCAKLTSKKDKKKRRNKVLISINVLIHVGLLTFYKYFEFFLINLEAAFSLLGINIPLYGLIAESEFLFPVGLSFYSFQGLSYAIDHYRNPKRDAESLFNVMLFVSFFPTILAGPILRAKDFFAQLKGETIANDKLLTSHLPKKFDEVEQRKQDVLLGFTFILSGLFKKVVLASYLSEHIVRDVFLTPEFYASPTVLVAVYAYAMQIYCDFSGYSDLAVGIGRLMGYRLPQNFNAPYLALSLQDFWRRWHISLSTWLRDYLYIPLGGNKRGIQSINLLITMTIGGLWHGAHLRYFIWGFMHGLGLAVVHAQKKLISLFQQKETSQNLDVKTTETRTTTKEKNTVKAHGSADNGIQAEKKSSVFRKLFTIPYTFGAWFLTFHFVCLLWVFFRADDTEKAMEIIEKIWIMDLNGDGFAALVLVAIACTMFSQRYGSSLFKGFVTVMSKLWAPVQICIFALICALILKFGPDGVLPFIYFQY